MATIKEGEVLQSEHDLSQLIDFGDDDALETASTTQSVDPSDVTRQGCPSHPADNCLCHGFMGNWDCSLTQQESEVAITTAETGSYDDFANWIPRYSKPQFPCDYCTSRQLECFIFITEHGQTTCSPCHALFRECSFTREADEVPQPQAGVIDTLHVVSEDLPQELGALTGIRSLKSFPSSNINASSEDSERGRKSGNRFPKAAVKILRDWLDLNSHHPYPNEEEKEFLRRRTGLSASQISNWLANARRRGKVPPKRPVSPSVHTSSQAINIPQNIDRTIWENLNPLERWKHSPPENEPADVGDIAHAVSSKKYDPVFINSTPANFEDSKQNSKQNSSGSSYSAFRAPSIISHRTTKSSGPSLSESAWSGSRSRTSLGSFGSFNSGIKKERQRRRKTAKTTSNPKLDSNSKPRIFQCTFCTDRFQNKYDWTRHEKSLHLTLEKWICAPLGPVVTCSRSGEKRCVYCDESNPTSKHSQSHSHEACENRDAETRTFYRKDHLRQHLRLMHNCELIPSMESWKSSIKHLNSRCGFCSQTFTVWQERNDHLTKHFRNGALMKDWKGCRGLDPDVAAQVTKSMPPYLIGQESMSPVPFSATNQTSLKHCMSYEPEFASQYFETFPGCPSPRNTQKMTCWEILTIRLGHFTLEKEAQGITPSDEMLQDYARRILYDNDDPWNQTAADNPEWLALFKKAHGLLTTPEDAEPIERDRSTIPACWSPQELEKWGDLGLCVPFSASGNHSGNHFTSLLGASGGVDHSMEGNQSDAFELPSNGPEDMDFDFDQIFTMIPESEEVPRPLTMPELGEVSGQGVLSEADIAFGESLIHGLDE